MEYFFATKKITDLFLKYFCKKENPENDRVLIDSADDCPREFLSLFIRFLIFEKTLIFRKIQVQVEESYLFLLCLSFFESTVIREI